MTRRVRPLALAAAINLAVCVGGAAAQTVYVRNAGSGDAVEVFINNGRVATATIDSAGEAQIPVDIKSVAGKDEMDSYIYVDSCPKLTRVLIIGVGHLPPPEETCRRSAITGLFWVRTVNTIVVNLAGQPPSLLLVVGKYTPPAPGTENAPRSWAPAPTGIVGFGGGLYGRFSEYSTDQCGNVAVCEPHDGGFSGFHAGGAFWITRFIAGEAAYVKLPSPSASGGGTGFRFDSELDARLVTVAGLVGAQGGPMRFYGKVGAVFHRATSTITQTNDPQTITIDDVPVTIEGGTQTFETTTEGWGWLFGGGAEAWLSRRIAIYGELDFARVQGNPTSGGEGELDDRVMMILFGLRVHIGG
jgi:hypothetical protein